MSKGPPPSKSSFTAFWKRSRDDDPPKGSSGSSSMSPSARSGDVEDSGHKDRAEIRRDQVRKAQILHRQRKASYVKQLELDIDRLRDSLAHAQAHIAVLRAENHATANRLSAAFSLASPRTRLQPLAGPSPSISFSMPTGTPPSTTGSWPAFSSTAAPQLPSQATYTITDMPNQADSTSTDLPNLLESSTSTDLPKHAECTKTKLPRHDLCTTTELPSHSACTATKSCHANTSRSALTSPTQAIASLALNPHPPSALLDEVLVTLSMHNVMGTPAFHVSTAPGSVSTHESSHHIFEGFPALSVVQEQVVINFILSLEHVCWDHFKADDFYHQGDRWDDWSRHALTASAFCMASAPPSVYEERGVLRQRRRHFYGNQSQPAVLSWRSSGPTLQSLHGLAASTNLDVNNLTPVQAWFELASRFPASVALDACVLDALCLHLAGVVRCVQFGAAIERSIFEPVVQRVLESYAFD